jgi:tetratricopeptide (TPR) repeat protein
VSRHAWTSAVLAAVVVAGAIGAFLPSLSPDFVNWDDPDAFVENPHYRGLGARQLTWMLTTFHMGHYMPLTWLTLGWDYAVWGMSAWGYRLTNLLLHAGTALGFYFLALRLLARALGRAAAGGILLRLGAAAAALFFAAHPLRAESVAWITERRDVLSGLFYVTASLTYVKAVDDGRRHVGLYWTSVALFTGALLSKSITATLPVALLVLDIYPLRRLGGRAGWARWHVWGEKLPFFVLGLAASALAFVALLPLGNMRSLEGMPPLLRVVLALYSLAFYLWKTVWPADLSPLYTFPLAVTYYHFALALGGTVLALILPRRLPAFSASWLVYAVTLLPVSGLFHNGPQSVADRYSYLSCMPWALWVGAAVAWRGGAGVAARLRATALRTLAAAGLVLFGLLAWQQAAIWHDSVALWRHALKVDPESRSAHAYLGRAFADEGMVAEAVAQYEEAARRFRNKPAFHLLIARLLEDDDNDRGALAYYRDVLEAAPGQPDACAGVRRIAERMEVPAEAAAGCPGAD